MSHSFTQLHSLDDETDTYMSDEILESDSNIDFVDASLTEPKRFDPAEINDSVRDFGL